MFSRVEIFPSSTMIFLHSKFCYCVFVFMCVYVCKSSVRATPPVCESEAKCGELVLIFPLAEWGLLFLCATDSRTVSGWVHLPSHLLEMCRAALSFPRCWVSQFKSSGASSLAQRSVFGIIVGIVIQQLVFFRHTYRGGLQHAGLHDGLFEKLPLFS